jgi:molybdenum cofactor cytidylyltransferase
MISAILLSAGESKRMGSRNKLLLPFGSTTLIEQSVDHLLGSKAQEVIVVLGHEATRVREVLTGRKLKFVENHHYREGMTSSIQAGLRAIASEANGMMICLSDLPNIDAKEFDTIIDVFEAGSKQNEKLIVVPTHRDKRGNPVIFASHYRAQILSHEEPGGCKGVIEQNLDQVVDAVMSTAHVLEDIDTETQYESRARGY